MKEQLDPTVYTILTARSKIPGVSLSEFAAFTPKWLNTQNTFRPPVRQVSFLSTKRKPAV
jgi:homogentisate 1,2-dioxygenase